ncbi:MAG TPA: 3-hydroxyacyl-CoA dehydrogenase family protein [Desulfatiglandales bacterium]|nr:3-hydroxyacyl-CoA dehydrogenase family protein [Desulfatiglandales bacterium]
MTGTTEKVAIIGVGTQGAQIAYRCAVSNKTVYLFDTSKEMLDKATQKITTWLDDHVKKGKLTKEEADLAFKRIHVCATLADSLADVELAIESVPEDLDLKRKVWADIDSIAPAKTLLTTNSSSLRSSEIAGVTTRKDRTFNVNFSFPVDDYLVEVMWNKDTSEETKVAVRQFLDSLHMAVVETRREIKGFTFNRVWRAIKKECLFLYGNGYCNPQDLDRAWMLEFGTPFGPFGLMDMIGLDVVRDIELSYYHDSGNESDKPPKSLYEMIERGHLGVKTGKGFYEYPNPAYERPDFLFGQSPRER